MSKSKVDVDAKIEINEIKLYNSLLEICDYKYDKVIILLQKLLNRANSDLMDCLGDD